MRKADKAELKRLEEERSKCRVGSDGYTKIQEQIDAIRRPRERVNPNLIIKAAIGVGVPVSVYLIKEQAQKRGALVDKATSDLMQDTKNFLK